MLKTRNLPSVCRCSLIVLLGLLAACGDTAPYGQAPEVTSVALQAQATSVINPSAPTPSLPPAPSAAVTPAASPVASPIADTSAARIDRYMQEHKPAFSGAILVAQKGKVLISKGYGLADRENDVPNTPQTKFGIGSITKSFTAMAIMILQERGRLKVQDLICTYIPNCPPAWRAVNLHHLLTHTSGIISFTDSSLDLKDKIDICKNYEPEAFIAYFKDLPLEFAPGSQWRYSNSGYFLLGMVIEKVSGESYESFIQKNVLQPLDMAETGYDQTNTIVKNRALGYTLDSSRTQLVDVACWDVSLKYAAGGLYSTVEDLYRWDQAFFGNQLVSNQTLNTILTPFISTSPVQDSGAYGYGWFIAQQSGHREIEHGGVVFGFVTELARYPDDRVTVIVLSNVDTEDPAGISRDLAAVVFAKQ